jgi:sulfite reductase beta subunit-like hemoprotein
MWDDVSIGEMSGGCSAIAVCHIGMTTVSQNSKEYWIDNLILDGEMKIAKDTLEGKQLASMIEKKMPPSKILNYLNRVFLKNCDTKKLQEKIADFGSNEYERGRREKAAEIRDVLGI